MEETTVEKSRSYQSQNYRKRHSGGEIRKVRDLTGYCAVLEKEIPFRGNPYVRYTRLIQPLVIKRQYSVILPLSNVDGQRRLAAQGQAKEKDYDIDRDKADRNPGKTVTRPSITDWNQVSHFPGNKLRFCKFFQFFRSIHRLGRRNPH